MRSAIRENKLTEHARFRKEKARKVPEYFCNPSAEGNREVAGAISIRFQYMARGLCLGKRARSQVYHNFVVCPRSCFGYTVSWVEQAMRAVREAHSKDSEEIALIKARLKEEEVRRRAFSAPPPAGKWARS